MESSKCGDLLTFHPISYGLEDIEDISADEKINICFLYGHYVGTDGVIWNSFIDLMTITPAFPALRVINNNFSSSFITCLMLVNKL